MKRLHSLLLVLVLGTVGFLLAGEARADDDDDDDDDRKNTKFKTVDCDDGDTIAKALRKSDPRKPLVIKIIGVCHENVTIERSFITLRGIDPGSSQIRGVPEADSLKDQTITIRGAIDVIVENLTIANSDSSGVIVLSARATIRDSVVKDNGQDGSGNGIFVGNSGQVIIDSVVVENNPSTGIQISRGGSAAITNSLIQENGSNGVRLDEGANARIGVDFFGNPGANTIKGNGGTGVSLNRSSTARIENNTIEDNQGSGVGIFHGSSAQLVNNIVQGNTRYEVIVTDGSTAQLTGNTLTDDSETTSTGSALEVLRSSNVLLQGGNTLTQINLSRFAAALEAFHVVQVRRVQNSSGPDVLTGIRAISMGNFTTVDLRGSGYTLNGDVNIGDFGNFRVRGTGTINGDIFATSQFTRASERGGSNISLTGNCNGAFLGAISLFNCTIAPD